MIADDTAVEVRRRLPVAPEKVYAAFAEARWVGRWLSPSPQIALTLLRFDFREGGVYRFAGVRHAEGWRGALEQLAVLLDPTGRSRVD
jgi:uncharacterized protein YndB with AHSA1/START domain